MSYKRPWQPELVLMFIGALFASFCLASLAAMALQATGVAAFKSPDSFANVLLGTLSMQGATWILMFIFLRLHEVDWRDAFGLREPNLTRSLLLTAGILLPILVVIWPLQNLSILLLMKLGYPPENQRAVEMLLDAQSNWALGYFVFFAVVIAPVAEEFVFRGMLFPLVRQLGGPKLAWIGVSLLFALIHFDAAIFVPLFVLALIFTWLYEKTGCLAAPVLAHSLFNAANLILLIVVDKLGHKLPMLP
jgi:membrane protease YdiL (CAAX protease family)